MSGLFNKDRIKDFFNFKVLITETIMKYVFVFLLGIAALGGILSIISSWIAAFTNGNLLISILIFIGTPIAVVIGLILYAVILRIGFEALLIRFNIYREVKQINEKLNESIHYD